MRAARRRAPQASRPNGLNKKTKQELFLSAHDVKGDCGTFGFPAVAPAADSLCRLLEHTPDMSRIPLAIIDQHVDAVRAIVREYARPDITMIAARADVKAARGHRRIPGRGKPAPAGVSDRRS